MRDEKLNKYDTLYVYKMAVFLILVQTCFVVLMLKT